MKHWMAALGALAMLVGFQISLARAAEHEGGKVQTITGEVVDVACYVGSGARGATHKGCAEACAKAGGSLGIVEDGTDKLFLVVSAKPGGDPKAPLMEHIAHKVQVTGPVSMRGGVSTIAVQSVKMAAQPAGATKAP
jgi:hypothetical protein